MRIPCITAAFAGGLTASGLELGSPFCDLQCQQPVLVRSWSKPGTALTVEFAGQNLSAKAAENRKWMATPNPLEASAGGGDLTISEKGGDSRPHPSRAKSKRSTSKPGTTTAA